MIVIYRRIQILITNLGMIQALGELRKAQNKSKGVPPESNNSEIDKPH